ncbi:ferric reductase NAD binding domain-containing protein [Blyttiomyces helicus]|uniref:Ferric reductase NAD binding domain-containing protein n=1 Tax=Blyttiomyces helicus TaxID=388810 RepID=A0A4P9VYM6_9FUNG|nr:ferric reductase NAD binding domain-containing protein [Blyttiomyces helicus]|eukprot:RKO83408.1 ferric reductase NAD binding domain-containing protein [Blyttiomyces helicus]
MNTPLGQSVALRKVHFIWIARDTSSLEWFQDLLAAIESENIDSFLTVRVHLTAPLPVNHIKNIVVNYGADVRDAITGLRAPTRFGRPEWDRVFAELKILHPGVDVGVFYCGPEVLGKVLERACRRWTEAVGEGTRFFYGKGMLCAAPQ